MSARLHGVRELGARDLRLRVATAFAVVAVLSGCGADVAVESFGAAGATPQPGEDGESGTARGPGAVGGDGGDGGSVGSAGGAVEAPAGMRYVGYGRAAVAVPTSWGTNELRCGTPERDTVLIDVGGVRDCGSPRPAGVESVGVGRLAQDPPLKAGKATQVDGVAAWRTPITCEKDDFGGARTCHSQLAIPSLDASFAVASSTGRDEVEEILGRVRVLDDLVAVPGFRGYPETNGEAYAAGLRAAGLAASVREEFALRRDAGEVLDVAPEPGTMLRPGEVVTVRVAEGPRSAADDVYASVATSGAAHNAKDYLSDEQIRSNPTVTLHVGDGIRAYAKSELEISGALDGTSLAVDRKAIHPPAWRAVAPGRSTLTLSVPGENGKPAVIGVVTVIVR